MEVKINKGIRNYTESMLGVDKIGVPHAKEDFVCARQPLL